MKIECMVSAKAFIVFDGIFEHHSLENHYVTLDNLVANTKAYMNYYNFDSADIIDAETGEILVTLEKEEEEDFSDYHYNDDYAPECYDDF